MHSVIQNLKLTSLVLFSLLLSLNLFGQVSPPSSSSNDSIIIQLADPRGEVHARFVGEEFFSFELIEPLVLSALSGQVIEYNLEIESLTNGVLENIGQYQYVIDRSPPVNPTFSPHPDTYTQPVNLSIESNYQTFVTINNQVRTADDDGFYPLTGRAGQIQSYEVLVQAEDSVGNLSPITRGIYRIDRRQETESSAQISILSPRPGRFLNPQLLYIQHQSTSEIKYSLDGSDPIENGVRYTGPVLLSGQNIQLKVAALGSDGETLTDEITFSAGREQYPGIEQGYVGNVLDIQPVFPSMTYITTERSPTIFDTSFDRSLRLRPQPNALRTFTLRMFRGGESPGEFRLFFLLEGRQGTSPNILFLRQDPLGNHAYITARDTPSPNDILLPSGNRNFILVVSSSPDFRNSLPILKPQKLESVIESFESNPNSTVSLYGALQNQAKNIGPYVEFQSKPPTSIDSEITVEVKDNQLNISASQGAYFSFGPEPQGKLSGSHFWQIPKGYQFTELLTLWEQMSDGSTGEVLFQELISLNSQLPPGPQIEVSGREVEILSSFPVFYRIVSSNSQAPSLIPDFVLYEGPFDLKPLENKNLSYRVEAYAQIQASERSTISRTNDIFINTVQPPVPRVVGISTGGFLVQEQTPLVISNYDRGFRYMYQFWVDNELIDEKELVQGQGLLPVPEVEASGYLQISIESRDTVSDIDPINEVYELTIDRIPPEKPFLIHPADGLASNQPIQVTLGQTEDKNAVLFYRINNSPDVPSVYTGPFTLDVAPGTAKNFQISAFTMDDAGNTSEVFEAVFSLDKEPPPIPNIQIITESGRILTLPDHGPLSTNENVQVLIDSSYDVFLETDFSSRSLPIPGFGSQIYEQPIIIETEVNTTRTLRLLARAVDQVGNFSALTRLIEIQVRKEIPLPPDDPVISREGNAGILQWPGMSRLVEYRIGSQSYRLYTEPVTWSIPAGVEEVSIHFRAVDRAGNVSEEKRFTIPRRNQTSRPILNRLGIDGPFPTIPNFTVLPSRPNAEIRYELGIDSIAGEVGETSPIWNPENLYSPLEGETLEYFLSFKQFETGLEPSEEITYRFIVDRTPPLPPDSELEQKLIVYSGIQMAVNAIEGQPYYKVQKQVISDINPPQFELKDMVIETGAISDYQLYVDGIDLPGNPGQVVRYLISAIAEDEAGNFSTRARAWEIIVDRQNVYLDAAAGQQRDGTQLRPFRNLDEALGLIQGSERNRLFLARGTYTFSRTVEIQSPLMLKGGFDSNWNSGGFETILVSSPVFQGQNLFQIGNLGTLTLSALYLTDPPGNASYLIRNRGGEFIGNNGLVLASAGNLRLLSTENSGQSSLSDTQIISYEGTAPSAVEVSGNSILNLDKVRFDFPATPAFLGDSSIRSRNYSVIKSTDSQINLDTVTIAAAFSRIATSIDLLNSQANITRLSLEVPNAVDLSLGIHGKNSEISVRNAEIEGNETSSTTALIRLDGGSLDIRDTRLEPKARLAASGIIGIDAIITSIGNRFPSGAAQDFITLFQLTRSKIDTQGTQVLGGWTTSELVFASLESVTGTWIENTIGLSNTGQTLGFHMIRGGVNEIVDNRLTGSVNSVALYIADFESQVRVQDNVFSNWGNLLIRRQAGIQLPGSGSSVFSDIGSLESQNEDGQIFTGNRVELGL